MVLKQATWLCACVSRAASDESFLVALKRLSGGDSFVARGKHCTVTRHAIAAAW